MNLGQLILGDKITELWDTDDRPVSEATLAGLDHVSCPYPDQRHGRPMNQEALRQVSAHWTHTMDWVSQENEQRSSLRDSLKVALWASIEPVLFHLRNPKAAVPADMSVRYKACLGFCQLLFFLIWNDPDPDSASLADYGTANDFFQWLDREHWLLGQIQACPGPKVMIEQLFTRFCSARPEECNEEMVAKVLCLVALQSAHFLSGDHDKDSLASTIVHNGQAPWLFALVQNPTRDPKEVSKLFPLGVLPEKVRTLLKEPRNEELFLSLHNDTRQGFETELRVSPALDTDSEPLEDENKMKAR